MKGWVISCGRHVQTAGGALDYKHPLLQAPAPIPPYMQASTGCSLSSIQSIPSRQGDGPAADASGKDEARAGQPWPD